VTADSIEVEKVATISANSVRRCLTSWQPKDTGVLPSYHDPAEKIYAVASPNQQAVSLLNTETSRR
jgi:hypothetical protein